MPEFDVVRIGYRHAEPGSILMQLPAGALIAMFKPRSEKPTLVPAWRNPATPMIPGQLAGDPVACPTVFPAAATITVPAAVISAIASLIRRRAVAGAAEAHVDHARGGRVGRDAGNGKTCRPAHPGENVGVVTAALAEHAHRQHAQVGPDARHAHSVVGDRSDDSGDLRAVPRAVLALVLAGGRIERAALIENAVGVVRLGGRDPIAGIRRIVVARGPVVGDVAEGDHVVAGQQLAARATRRAGPDGRSARRYRERRRRRPERRSCSSTRSRCRSTTARRRSARAGTTAPPQVRSGRRRHRADRWVPRRDACARRRPRTRHRVRARGAARALPT